jgi:phage gp29-like protein
MTNGETKVVVKNRMEGALNILWPVGWLFTIGYCHLATAQGLFAILIWPYYLGVALRH